jgi:hypothetical protein
LDALLRDVSTLRLTLDSDLTVAAAAAEADRLDVAAEIVDFDRAELAAFAERAIERLREADAEVAAAPVRPQDATPTLRHRMALAAGPAMLAAAAVIAVVGLSGGSQGTPAGVTRPQLMASYSAFSALVKSDNNPGRLVAIGHQLNASVEQLIAGAAHDPAKARQALRILEAEQYLLTQHHPSGSETLLAQARALVRRLQQTIPSSVLTVVPVRPAPVGTLAPPVLSVVVPTTSSTHTSKPAPTQTPAASQPPVQAPPSAQPTPEPTSGEATVPPEPSPEPSSIDPWPFGDTGFGGDSP